MMALNVCNKYNNSENTPLSRAVVLHEDPNESPNEEEIKLYASSIGIDLAKEPALAWIAKEGISAPLPRGWQVLQDENNQIFYYNASSGQSLWDHPLDSHYRNRVRQARKLLNPMSRASQPIVNTPSRSPGRHSCSTPTHGSNRLSSLSSQQIPTPAVASCGKAKQDGESKPHFTGRAEQTPYWADTPLLGEESRGGTSSVESRDIVGTVISMSETELPTEYCELVPSSLMATNGTKPHSLSHSVSVLSQHPQSQTTTTAAQTDANDLTSANFNSTVGQNFELTATDSQSEQANQTASTVVHSNGNDVPLNTNIVQQNFSLHSSSLTQQKPILFGMDTDRRTGSESFSAVGNRKDDKQRTNHPILDSPAAKVDRSVETLVFRPELGSSPTENESNELAAPDTDSVDREHGNTAVKHNPKSHVTGIHEQPLSQSVHTPVLCLQRAVNSCPMSCQPTMTFSLPETDFTSHNMVHSPNPKISKPDFNEGMNHLVEERARLQRKLLRIKLIYKNYKQRLISLDSSLQLLQNISNTGPSLTPNELEHRNVTQSDNVTGTKKLSQDPNPNFCTVTTSPLFRDLSPTKPSPGLVHQNPYHSYAEVVMPEIVNIREDSRPPSNAPYSFKPKSGRSLSTPRHSLSLSGSILLSRPVGIRTLTTCNSHTQASPLDVAHSLASIDAQLHRVIHHLESSDASAACNDDLLKNHTLRQSIDDCLHLNPCWVDSLNLEDEMQKLSIRKRKENVECSIGDLRLLTPVSLEDKVPNFQRPHVDVSPTWHQSD